MANYKTIDNTGKWTENNTKYQTNGPEYCENGLFLIIQGTGENEDKGLYWFDANGIKKSSTWYPNANANAATTGKYYFQDNGKAIIGWNRYVDLGQGNDNGKNYKIWFYFSSADATYGQAVTGIQKIVNTYYYFDTQGKMQSVPGWVFTNSNDVNYKKYYIKNDDNNYNGFLAKSEWRVIDGHRYYFNNVAVCAYNTWVKIGKKYYWFEPNSGMQTNKWIDTPVTDNPSQRQYINQYGERVSGWYYIDGKYYYFDPNNSDIMVRNSKTIEGHKYIFNQDGSLKPTSYANNVVLTEDAFKHLLQNTAIVNTTNGSSTIGKYYHIDSNMKKHQMNVIQTLESVISTTSPHLPLPGTIGYYNGIEENNDHGHKSFTIPGWPVGDDNKPINFNEAFVKTKKALATSATQQIGTNLQIGNYQIEAEQNDASIRDIYVYGYLGLGTYPTVSKNSSGKWQPVYGSDVKVGFWLDATTTASPIVKLYNITSAENGVCFKATKVFNAVFNDYAEYRATTSALPGQCVVDNDDGSMRVTDKRLMPGASVVSDTFGTAMGMTDECKTPLAVAGRVLVYPARDRSEYHAGMAVCASADGKVDIMTREEIRDYPDCIVGIVSEIPEYETWGSDNVKVDGRIWIKVR